MQTATAAAMQDAPVGREEALRAACLGVLDHYLEGAGIEPARRRFLRDHFLLDVEQVARLPKTEAGGGSLLEESFSRLVDGWLDLAIAVP